MREAQKNFFWKNRPLFSGFFVKIAQIEKRTLPLVNDFLGFFQQFFQA